MDQKGILPVMPGPQPILSALSPCGFTAGGLPLALQVAGRPFDEATVLRIVHVYEQAAAPPRSVKTHLLSTVGGQLTGNTHRL